MRRVPEFLATVATIFAIGCEAHWSTAHASPGTPPPPEPVYVRASAEDAAGYEDEDPSALDDFRATLDPYGTWVDDDTYGTVWLPSRAAVGLGFVPYESAGHWVYDDGYVWVSDYPWGWAPFHYGRWAHIEGRGWAWVPGRLYAGAWVTWRVGTGGFGYVGWAPMPPAWIWRHREPVRLAFTPVAPDAYCARDEVFAPALSRHVVRGGAAVFGMESRTHLYAPVAHPEEGRQARFATRGPPPAALRLDPSQVARPSPSDEGLRYARQHAAPSTARPISPGVAAPQRQSAPPAPRPAAPIAPVAPAQRLPRAVPPMRAPSPPVQPVQPAPVQRAPAPRTAPPPRPPTQQAPAPRPQAQHATPAPRPPTQHGPAPSPPPR